MTANQTLQYNTLSASISLIKDKLERIRKYIATTYKINGGLPPDEQFAMRVLASRCRELDRWFIIETSPPNDPARRNAEAELQMAHRDTGELFRWRVSNHSFGRLGCTGCEFDLVGLARVPLTGVCHCGKGVLHSLLVESQQEFVEGLEGFWKGVGLFQGQESLWGASGRPGTAILGPGGGILMVCEACGQWEVRPCPAS